MEVSCLEVMLEHDLAVQYVDLKMDSISMAHSMESPMGKKQRDLSMESYLVHSKAASPRAI